MKRLKYTFRTVVQEPDIEGNPMEREIFTEMSVPDNESGRTLAEKESYDGVIIPYDDGEPDPAVPANDDNAVWNELDKAYEEGYGEGYKEGVDNAYDE